MTQFNLLELDTFVYLGYALARAREEDPLITSKDPEGFAAAKRTYELLEAAIE